MWKCADPELERQIRCFPYGERSNIPRLQQVEQKAVGRQRNLGIRIVVWILVTYMYPQCMKVHHPNASSIISIIINIWLYFVLVLYHLFTLFLQMWHIFGALIFFNTTQKRKQWKLGHKTLYPCAWPKDGDVLPKFLRPKAIKTFI